MSRGRTRTGLCSTVGLMNPDDKTRNGGREADGAPQNSRNTPLSEQESLRKDMSYSPASETETQQKQQEPLPDTIDDDIDADDVRVVPGTGGPDDAGDVEVDPDELNMPGPPSPQP
jgi:hypothetical protein